MNDRNKSSNGFLFGMMVGGALVFLLGTKKGRQILKNLSEKGLDVLDDVSNIEELEEYMSGDFDGELEEENEETTEKTTSSPQRKRFFKGVKKR